MYEAFFGFREKPFTIQPDPDFLFLSRTHSDVWTHLEYAVQENQGFVVITGEVGAGKTTLINELLRRVERTLNVGVISNTAVPPEQFLRAVCEEFDIPAAAGDKGQLLSAFNRFLLNQFAGGNRVVLIVDEAQNLGIETLEELRLLSNLQTEKQLLLQIILVGQPQLRETLRKKALLQLRQRITVQCHLAALSADEVASYVRHRLKIAGCPTLDLIDAGAIEAVARYSRGVPRLVNAVCDSALVAAFADGRRSIDRPLMEQVISAREAGGTLEAPTPGFSTAAPRVSGNRRLEGLEARLSAAEEAIQRLDGRLNGALERVKALIEQLKALRNRSASIENLEPPAPLSPSPKRSFFRFWRR